MPGSCHLHAEPLPSDSTQRPPFLSIVGQLLWREIVHACHKAHLWHRHYCCQTWVQLCSGENHTVWNTGELPPSPSLIFVISKMEAIIQVHSPLSKMIGGTSLVVQGLRSCFPTQVVQIPSLVRELRPHMPFGQKKQNLKNRSTIVTNSIKTLKMIHIKKIF